MSDTDIVHADLGIASYPINHPKHGNAVCDDRQWPEFQAAGWKKGKAKPAESDPPK